MPRGVDQRTKSVVGDRLKAGMAADHADDFAVLRDNQGENSATI